jgi:hypothetical protein
MFSNRNIRLSGSSAYKEINLGKMRHSTEQRAESISKSGKPFVLKRDDMVFLLGLINELAAPHDAYVDKSRTDRMYAARSTSYACPQCR